MMATIYKVWSDRKQHQGSMAIPNILHPLIRRRMDLSYSFETWSDPRHRRVPGQGRQWPLFRLDTVQEDGCDNYFPALYAEQFRAAPIIQPFLA